MHPQRSLLTTICLILLFVPGCSAAPTAPAPDHATAPLGLSELAGSEWQLVSLRSGGEEVEVMSASRPTLAVEASGKVHGLATLNRYFGQMELREGGHIHWASPMGSTMMSGPEPLMDQEVRFLRALQGARKAALRDGLLVLEDEEGLNVLEFRR